MEIVWTGPVLPLGFNIRPTPAVIRSLVSIAKKKLLLAGYTLDVGTLEHLGIFAALKRGLSLEIVANAADMKEDTWEGVGG